MGTKKTDKPLEWLQPLDSNPKRTLWALNYLRRAIARLPLLDTADRPLDKANFDYWINELQQSFDQRNQPDIGLIYQLQAEAIESLDTRMRHAWDSQVGRHKPGMKVFTFSMSKETGPMLSVLRNRFIKPKARIVEALIEDAYSKEKRLEELEKAPARAQKQKQRVDTQILRLKEDRKTAEERATLLENLAERLLKKMTETQYRQDHNLPPEKALADSHRDAIKELTDEAMAGYREAIEDELAKNAPIRRKEALEEPSSTSVLPGGPMPANLINPPAEEQ